MDSLTSLRAWFACQMMNQHLGGYRQIVRKIAEYSGETTCQFPSHEISISARTDIQQADCTIHPSLPYIAIAISFRSPSRFVDGGSAVFVYSTGPYKIDWKQKFPPILLQNVGPIQFHPTRPIMGVSDMSDCPVYRLTDGEMLVRLPGSPVLSWHPFQDLVLLRQYHITSVWSTRDWSDLKLWTTPKESYLTKFLEYETDPVKICTLIFSDTPETKTIISVCDMDQGRETRHYISSKLGHVKVLIQAPSRNHLFMFLNCAYLCLYDMKTREIKKTFSFPAVVNVKPFGIRSFVGHYCSLPEGDERPHVVAWVMQPNGNINSVSRDVKGCGMKANRYKTKVHPLMRCTAMTNIRSTGVFLVVESF